jgi:hypothetical protein
MHFGGFVNEMRAIKAAPFCWQHKAALRKIREAFDAEKSVASALGVYHALTEIASDKESESFETTHGWIAHKSGLSPRTVQDRLAGLSQIGLVEISTPALKSPSTYRLLSVPQPLPNARQRAKNESLPTLEQGENKELNKGKESPLARKREPWQLLKDETALRKRIADEREKVKPDKDLIESLKTDLRQVRAEMKGQTNSKESL